MKVAISASRVVLLDSGGANIGSVLSAFDRLGVAAEVSSNRALIGRATHVVLPGVGTASKAMSQLRSNGLDKLIPTISQPLLGICVGMQLLFEKSEEGGTECLGLLPGVVRKLVEAPGLRVPHMGWNQITCSEVAPLVAGLDGEWLYFVHSYAANVADTSIARCRHTTEFAAAVAHGSVMGVQFHPERSSVAGTRLLSNFLSIR